MTPSTRLPPDATSAAICSATVTATSLSDLVVQSLDDDAVAQQPALALISRPP